MSELSRLPQLSVSAQHSKVHNPISPLLLFAILKACFHRYPFSISPFFLFSSSSFAFLAISCFLSSSTYLSGELKQWKLQQTLHFCGPLHSQKRLRNLLQHDKKMFKPCFIVTRPVSPMLSEMLSTKIQWMTLWINDSTVIKVLLSHNYSNCSLSSLFIFISNCIRSCSSKLSSSLLFI